MSKSPAPFPEYVDGKPPVFTMKEYDEAPWLDRTCLDHDKLTKTYKIVSFEDQSYVVGHIDKADNEKLDKVFFSLKLEYAYQKSQNEKKSKD